MAPRPLTVVSWWRPIECVRAEIDAAPLWQRLAAAQTLILPRIPAARQQGAVRPDQCWSGFSRMMMTLGSAGEALVPSGRAAAGFVMVGNEVGPAGTVPNLAVSSM